MPKMIREVPSQTNKILNTHSLLRVQLVTPMEFHSWMPKYSPFTTLNHLLDFLLVEEPILSRFKHPQPTQSHPIIMLR